MNDDFTQSKLMDGSAVFLNYWNMAEPSLTEVKKHYDLTILPGRNEELSSSSVSGYNIGINSLLTTKVSEDKNVSNTEKLEACVKVTEFLTSEKTQKFFFIKKESVAAIPTLYEDAEVCQVNDCELFKIMQPVVNRVLYEVNGGMYERAAFETKFRNLAFKYIFENNVDLKETLTKMEDITKIYKAPLDFKDISVGFVMMIIIVVIALLMLLSLIFLFLKKFKPFFTFLTIDLWFILVTGSVLVLITALMDIGDITVVKCHFRKGLLEVGMKMYLSVILYELAVNLPPEIKLSAWIKNHKYVFLLLLFSIDVSFNGLLIIDPYDVKIVIKGEGHNYRECVMNSIFGKVINIIMIIEKVFLVLTILFLLFMEWNMRNIYYEVRFILFSIYTKLLLILVSFLVEMVNINNYYIHFVITECLLILVSLIGYSCLYGYKLFFALWNGESLEFISNKNKSFIDDNDIQVEKTFEESYGVNYSFKTTNYMDSMNNCESAIGDVDGRNANNDNGNGRRTNGNNINNNEQKNAFLKFLSRVISFHYSPFLTNNENNNTNKNNNNNNNANKNNNNKS